LKKAIQSPPRDVGINMAKWTWKVVRTFVQRCWGLALSRSCCLNYLHRLGFVQKRPKKRLKKADPEKRAAFVSSYRQLRAEAASKGAKVFFVDEAHFRADVCLRTLWVLRGVPALIDSTSPRLGEKVSYYSGVCLETGEVEAMPVMGSCNAETSVAFLRQLRARYSEPLIVIWDNSPAHRGDAMRTYLSTPELNLRLVALPSYSPDFNADEAIWGWAREEVTANYCYGTADKVREALDPFFAGLVHRSQEVTQRCRTLLQGRADRLDPDVEYLSAHNDHVVPTMASV
jgi:transposase